MAFRHVAVTGGTGFLGRKAVAALRESGIAAPSGSRSEGVDLHELTGWAPADSLQRRIEETAAWYQAPIGSELSHASS